MKKTVILLVVSTLYMQFNYGQKENNQFKLLAEAGIPNDQNKLGFGGYLKGAYGIGRSGQVTLMSGVSKFRSKIESSFAGTTTRIGITKISTLWEFILAITC
ncbi:MAG: hypothetical protein WKF97_16280 [Chitinophagaceae bacterium]